MVVASFAVAFDFDNHNYKLVVDNFVVDNNFHSYLCMDYWLL